MFRQFFMQPIPGCINVKKIIQDNMSGQCVFRCANRSDMKMMNRFHIGEMIMRQCMDSEKLHRRMNKIIGQLNAVDRMMDQDIPCENILIQINAAKSALHKLGQIVLEGHLKHCIRNGIEHGDAEKTLADFAKAPEHFSRMS